jgi:L-ascorbate metabolism protein UlaG (beta-lactamase superfamily)
MTPDFLKIGERYGPFDIAMVESGAYNAAWVDAHLGPEQAVDVSLMVRGRSMVPIHWGTFSLALHAWTEPAERLLAEARKKGVHLVIPIIGGSVSPSTPATDRPWWPEVDVRSADEDPIVSNNLPDYVLPQPLSPAH